MAILLVTYDLKQPGRNYTPVHTYLKQFLHCKQLESVWLLDTTTLPTTIRDDLMKIVDGSDVVLVTPITQGWRSYNYACGAWLSDPTRRW